MRSNQPNGLKGVDPKFRPEENLQLICEKIREIRVRFGQIRIFPKFLVDATAKEYIFES